ncbi:MAG: formyltransferase family protein [Bacteroidota bacterium]
MNNIISSESFELPDWGSYYKPAVPRLETDAALRVVLFGSAGAGMLTLEGLKKLKHRYGIEKIQLVGLATDDVRTDHARISLKKRIWRHFPPEMRVKMAEGIIQRAIDESMEVFTGNIKSAFFAKLLDEWKPDVIVMSCFGQIIPESVFTYPPLGMYNIHPSDLKNEIGIGAKPLEDTIALKMSHTCVSVHKVTETVDYGWIVGQSPPICIVDENGEYLNDILFIEERVTSVFPYMTEALVRHILLMKNEWEAGKSTVDLTAEIHTVVQKKLLESLTGVHGRHYPFPDPKLFDLFHPIPQQA